jgi:hypothetical protein
MYTAIIVSMKKNMKNRTAKPPRAAKKNNKVIMLEKEAGEDSDKMT